MPSDSSRRSFLAQVGLATAALGVAPALAGEAPKSTTGGTTAGGTAAGSTTGTTPAATATGPLELMALPYADTALAPTISQETISYHHGKHHKGYVDRANDLLKGTPEASKSLKDLVVETAGTDKVKLFNNVAQTWNHNFYWKSMKPGGGGEPTGKLAEAIKANFGSFADFKKKFADEAKGAFGSAWVWLVQDGGKLAIVTTSNADCPLTKKQTPLLTIDVWEHAYYIDHRNARAAYVDAWLDKLVNWEFAEKNLA